MADRLQPFRQPVVTASGILLGFILNYIQVWSGVAFKGDRRYDYEIGIGLSVCIALLIIVIYRILRIDYPEEDYLRYYKVTHKLFVVGLIVPFLTMAVIIVEKILRLK